MSQKGTAIRYINETKDWVIVEHKKGRNYADLHLPIRDPDTNCPYDGSNIKSNWVYNNGTKWIKDVHNSIRIHCLKGAYIFIIHFCTIRNDSNSRLWRSSIHYKRISN